MFALVALMSGWVLAAPPAVQDPLADCRLERPERPGEGPFEEVSVARCGGTEAVLFSLPTHGTSAREQVRRFEGQFPDATRVTVRELRVQRARWEARRVVEGRNESWLLIRTDRAGAAMELSCTHASAKAPGPDCEHLVRYLLADLEPPMPPAQS